MTVSTDFLPGPPADLCLYKKKGDMFLPFEGNCKMFYVCYGKTMLVKKCPGKLVFNPDRNTCGFMKHLSKTSLRFCRG